MLVLIKKNRKIVSAIFRIKTLYSIEIILQIWLRYRQLSNALVFFWERRIWKSDKNKLVGNVILILSKKCLPEGSVKVQYIFKM